MIQLWLGVALAGAADGEPAVRHEAHRLYPRPLYDDWSVDRRCALTVALDGKGRPTDLEPRDCPDELVDWTIRTVRKDRWDKGVADGTMVDVAVVYEAPWKVAELPQPQTWRRRDGAACALRVLVHPTGAVQAVSPVPGCAPGIADWAPLPTALDRRPLPKVCPVTFLVTDGEVRWLDLFRCPLRAWAAVRDGLQAWTWPATDAPAPYTVQLVLGGAATSAAATPGEAEQHPEER